MYCDFGVRRPSAADAAEAIAGAKQYPEKIEAIRNGSIPQYHPVQELHPIMRRGKLQALNPFDRGELGRGARGATSEKRGEWYPQVDMAAGPGSRRRHGRMRRKRRDAGGLLVSFSFFNNN